MKPRRGRIGELYLRGDGAVRQLQAMRDLDAFAPEVDLPLDPGIREYVLILRSRGIETFESCEGGPGHAFPDPTIRFHGNAFEGYKAFSEAMNHGLPVLSLRLAYDVNEMRLEGPWWEMTFRTTGPPSAD